MNCPRCGSKIVGHPRRCENCGQNLRPYEDIRRMSNRFYNEGLELARVRNLSGALDKLHKSLEYNKENIDARNLLGLVYYELGETVTAVVEWVISTNIRRFDNPADELLNKLQNDANEFNELTSAIKKFNIALEMAEQGKDDLAMIQVKKVVSLNPHYVKALLLLALLYMKGNENAKAEKVLKRALAVDCGNLTARRYLEDIKGVTEMMTRGGIPEGFEETEQRDFGAAPQNARVTPYREDKPNFAAFISFFAGVVIGVLIIFFFTVPGIEKRYTEDYNEKVKELGNDRASLETTISGLESDNSILSDRVKDLETELLHERNSDRTDYLAFIELYREYETLLETIKQCEEARDAEIAERAYAEETARKAGVTVPVWDSPVILFTSEIQEKINAFYKKAESFDTSKYVSDTVNEMCKEVLDTIGRYYIPDDSKG